MAFIVIETLVIHTDSCSSCLLIFQNIVPISLYITVEIVKTVGCLLWTSLWWNTDHVRFFRFRHISFFKTLKCITNLVGTNELVKQTYT